METPWRQRVVLGLMSVTAMLAVYTLLSNAYRFLDPSLLPRALALVLRPEILPPTQGVVEALASLVTGRAPAAGGSHVHITDHLGYLADQRVTLQGALLVSGTRVLFGVLVGGLLGILTGFAMGWSSALDGYLHPIFALVRSIPSLALITYVMLWVGYGEAHLLIPIVFAVFTTVVIPTYHGVRDLAPVYVVAARSLGASGPLLWLRVVVPGVTPAVLSALRYAIMMAWMTAVGVEMLMGNNGMGHLLVGGGLWSGRLTIRVDPAVVIAGILGLAATGYAMDAAARLAIGRLTFWTARRRQW
jgi:ABC-type nitrate/sulfonate/bicarbonate transport system permease component